MFLSHFLEVCKGGGDDASSGKEVCTGNDSPQGRESFPEAREKLLTLLSAAAPPPEHEEEAPSAAPITSSPHELWAAVLRVELEGAKAKKDWGLATALR